MILDADIHKCSFLVLCSQCSYISFLNPKKQEQIRCCSPSQGHWNPSQVRINYLLSSIHTQMPTITLEADKFFIIYVQVHPRRGDPCSLWWLQERERFWVLRQRGWFGFRTYHQGWIEKYHWDTSIGGNPNSCSWTLMFIDLYYCYLRTTLHTGINKSKNTTNFMMLCAN